VSLEEELMKHKGKHTSLPTILKGFAEIKLKIRIQKKIYCNFTIFSIKYKL